MMIKFLPTPSFVLPLCPCCCPPCLIHSRFMVLNLLQRLCCPCCLCPPCPLVHHSLVYSLHHFCCLRTLICSPFLFLMMAARPVLLRFTTCQYVRDCLWKSLCVCARMCVCAPKPCQLWYYEILPRQQYDNLCSAIKHLEKGIKSLFKLDDPWKHCTNIS